MDVSSSIFGDVASKALVPYDSRSLHVSVKKYFDSIADEAFKRAMKIMFYEAQHLSPVIRLEDRRLCHILPSLTGSHRIGHVSLVLEVPEQYYSQNESNKKIGVEIFSPVGGAIGRNSLMQMRPGYGNGTSINAQQIQTLHTHALDIDRLDPVENMSILIFSHGMGVDPIIYRPLLEELASHGFIVLNLNHPASSNHAPFSEEALDGHAFDALFSNGEKLDEAAEKMALTEAANIRFVVEQIRAGNLDRLPKNSSQKSKIILGGHSLGGASSVIASRDNPEIAGCIDLDGRLAGPKETKTTGLTVPVLVLCSEPETQSEEEDKMAQDFDNFRKNSSPLLYTQKMIGGVKHMDFTMHPILNWLVGGTYVNGGLKAHVVASQEILRFMKGIEGGQSS